MTVPYTPQLISRLLRGMSDARVRATTPHDFQLYPVAKKIVPTRIVRDLISNELARRAA